MKVVAIVGLAVAVALWIPPRARPRTGIVAATTTPTPGRRLSVSLLARIAVAAGGLALFPGPVGLTAAIVVLVFGGRVLARWEPAAARRRRVQLESLVPLAVDLLAVALRTGASTQGALRDVSIAVPAPLAAELVAVVHRLEVGTDPELVWEELATHPQLAPLGRTLLRCSRSGAPIASALTRQADEQWAARRAQVEAQARGVDARTSLPLGLCLLPAFVLLGIVPMVAEGFAHGLLQR